MSTRTLISGFIYAGSTGVDRLGAPPCSVGGSELVMTLRHHKNHNRLVFSAVSPCGMSLRFSTSPNQFNDGL